MGKSRDIEEVVELLRGLNSIQVGIIESIIERFAKGVEGELLIDSFLNEEAFEFFAVRLSAHHAYSSEKLKKENFEHILAQSFNRIGVVAAPVGGMTQRGADLRIGDLTVSLKTEAAATLRVSAITISKLMEAAWIKTVATLDDIPPLVGKMVLPHFDNYDRIFILRSYDDPTQKGRVRYDLHEIPKQILASVGQLTAADFSALSPKGSTTAKVIVDGKTAFTFRLDGSDDKLTISGLAVELCPLHAWWILDAPG